MNKQAAPILVSVLLAVGTVGVSYAAAVSASVADEPQGSSPIEIREAANVALGSGIPARRMASQMLTIDGENDTVKVLTEQEVRFQHDERTHMNAHPVLAIKSGATWSLRAMVTRSISPVMRLKRNSREE
jgi:hypothetical protein